MNTPGLTRRLTRLIREKEATPADLRAAERYVRDWLGSFVAGRTTEPGRMLVAQGGETSDPEGRVFLAAALSHVTETDDLHRGSTTHPGCAVVPVAWLLARERQAPPRAMLRAVLDGYEAMLRVGESLGPGHYRTFHNTATAGVFGAAAAAASLLGLDEDGWVWALGSAGTQAAGLWQFNADAAMSKHLHAGHAASAGLRSALLAEHGFTGAERILEGERGFYRALCPDPAPEAVTAEGAGWKLGETSLKPYPCCRHTHPVIDAALALRRELGWDGGGGAEDGSRPAPAGAAERVEELRIATYGPALRLTDRRFPETSYGAQFSLQYCAATALLDGVPTLDSFAPERLARREVRSLLGRTSVELDPELDRAWPERWGGQVTVATADAGERRVRRTAALGDPEAPLGDDALDRKLRALLVHGGLEAGEADAWLAHCRGLPEADRVPSLPWPPTPPAAVPD